MKEVTLIKVLNVNNNKNMLWWKDDSIEEMHVLRRDGKVDQGV